jgi:formaldehyde-activating enzyme
MPEGLYTGDVVLHDAPHTVHVTLTLGAREGPFQTSYASTLAHQRPRYIAFTVCAQPNIPVLPRTVYVNKNPYLSEAHGAMHWGPGHNGVAAGMMDGLQQGVVTESQAEELLCIAVVWIWETAIDMDRVGEQTRKATLMALEHAMASESHRAALEDAIGREGFHNPFHKIPPSDGH